MITHPFPPVCDENSKVLILGSFPSVKSREEMFFYGHPQNRFWKVISAVFQRRIPVTVNEKRVFLLECGIALWDVIASCDVVGSSDSTVKNVVTNDISPILEKADIRQIYVNGKTAEKYFKKYTQPIVHRNAICLPSTSPANASWSLDRLVKAWEIIKSE